MDSDSTSIYLAALDAAGEMVLPLEGASMGSNWSRADAVRVEASRRHPARWGDVVVFERHGRLYAHRVILRIGPWLLTKGDARWAWDRPWVSRAAVLGVVSAILACGTALPDRPGNLARATGELIRALLAAPWFSLTAGLRKVFQ